MSSPHILILTYEGQRNRAPSGMDNTSRHVEGKYREVLLQEIATYIRCMLSMIDLFKFMQADAGTNKSGRSFCVRVTEGLY